MKFREKIHSITASTVDELRKIEKEIAAVEKSKSQYSKEHYTKTVSELNDKRTDKILSGRQQVREALQSFNDELDRSYTLKGEELTQDAALLRSGVKLNTSDLDGLMRKYNGNKTMQRLFSEYATENNIQLTEKYIGKEEKSAAAKAYCTLYENAVDRIGYDWLSEQYLEAATPAELADD